MATPDYKLGAKAKVMIGSSIIKGLNKIAIPGIVRATVKIEEFNQDIDFELPTSASWEKGSIEGNYVPGDTAGQEALRAKLLANEGISDIKLYEDATSYWAPDTATDANSKIYVTQVSSLDVNKSGVIPFKAEFVVQGAFKRFANAPQA